jgi:hypothetical protein
MSKIKRLRRELESTEWTVNPEYTEIIISDSIRFSLPEYYPFKPPILWIHGLNHIDYLKQMYTQRKSLIQSQKYPLTCICCSTILCSWSPCMTCMDVYKEYTTYTQSLHYVDILQEMIQLPLDSLILDKISTFLL